MRSTTRLRLLLSKPEILVIPGVHDALGARLAEQAGFAAVVSGGYSATATLLGQPDTSQLTYTEMVDYYARLCDATVLPVVADADTGYGGIANVARTVRGYERAGVGALLLEDQVFPKRCGHFSGKSVVPRQEFVGKLKAALDARVDPDLVIIARSDALAAHGIDEAIERMRIARELGADLLFIDALEKVGDMRRFCTEAGGPCLASIIEGGRTPALAADELRTIGFAAVLFALSATYAMARAVREVFATLARTGSTAAVADRMTDFSEFNEIVGLSRYRRREAEIEAFAGRFLADREAAPRMTRRDAACVAALEEEQWKS